LIHALLCNARHNYYVLKGHSLATVEMTSEFDRLQMLLRCPASVAWQDHQHLQNNSHESVASETPVAGGPAAANNLVVYNSCQHVDIEHLLQFPRLIYKLSRENFMHLLVILSPAVRNNLDLCVFLSCVSTLMRNIDIANLSVRPSVRDVPVLDENGLT